MLNRNRAFWASTALLTSLAMSTAVHAQETTGGIVGSVYDASGSPVSGASITVTHIPSGTSSTTVTAANGSFSARGLRVGGPYSVTAVTGSGEATSDVASISIGAPYALELVIGNAASDGSSVDDVVVTGTRVARNTSPTTGFNLNDVETLPSIGRDIKDFVRTSPFATTDASNFDALSIGGQNTRYNAFLVDGVRQGDDFGLNSNGYPTQGTPVSLSIIEAVSVAVSPYDVQYGGFTGGVINSVTKSGGNDFHGEVFYEYTNDGLRGNSFSYENFQTGARINRQVTGQFNNETWGATLSGPILRDRLFFLLNYEKAESLAASASTGPTGSSAVNQIPGITQADVDSVRTAVQSAYGFDPLGWETVPTPEIDEKYFAKIDWNISDRHRAVLSYQSSESLQSIGGSNSTSSTTPILALQSSGYNYTQTLENYKAQLFSDWTDTFSTELSYSYKTVESLTQNLVDNNTAQFLVYLDNPAGTGLRRSIRLGPDISRHANELAVTTTLYRAVANWDLVDDHRLTFGFEREEQEIFNIFVQNANGTYQFASLADLRARNASSVTYTNAVTNVKADAGATFSYAQNTAFIQDTWRGIENLTLTAGIRVDWFTQDDRPLFNPAFQARYGFRNDNNLDGITQIQPRFGFNYRATPDLTIYGGFGRYQGGAPNVWISNAFSNTGNLAGSITCRAAGYISPSINASTPVCPAGSLTNINATQPNAPLQTAATNSANLGTGDLTPIDPTFKTPSIWKTSLGATYDFDLSRWSMGSNWSVTAEYVHSEQDQAVGWLDLSMLQNRQGNAPDGRPTYGVNPTNASQRVLMLTNAPGGQTEQVAIALNKDWTDGFLEGLSGNLSYTYLDATEATSPGSSTAWSSFQNTVTTDPNSFFVDTSSFEIREAWKLNVSYSRAFFGDYRTRINLFGMQRSGLPFSYVFNTAPAQMFHNNTAYSSFNQLLYVPQVDASGLVTATSDPRVRFSSAVNLADFNAFLQNTGLIQYAGQIAPRNGFRAPNVTTFDLHLSQEIPAFFPGGAKLELYADVENLGNLLNDEWGSIQQYNSPYSSSANVGAVNCATRATTACSAGTGNYYQYTSLGTASPQFQTNASVWQVKFGVRYTF